MFDGLFKLLTLLFSAKENVSLWVNSHELPPVLLVGVYSGARVNDPDPRVADVHAIEYLIGYGKTAERFEKHERFFTDEMLRWAESKYDAPKQREKRGIRGNSNSGAFAIAMGTKHFNTFGHVFGFSSAFQTNLLAPEWTDKKLAPRYYLVAGL
jgi:enterochelin esterase-like enzyme